MHVIMIIFISLSKHWQTKNKQKNNNIKFSENCHVEQLIIETVISNREET